MSFKHIITSKKCSRAVYARELHKNIYWRDQIIFIISNSKSKLAPLADWANVLSKKFENRTRRLAIKPILVLGG